MICDSSFFHRWVDDIVVDANNATLGMTDGWSMRVVFSDVLAECFVTKNAEQLAVRDPAKGLWTLTSEANDVPFTGVNLLLTPQPSDSLEANPRPSNHGVRADAQTTSQQRQAEVLVERFLPIAELVELLFYGILRSLLIAVCCSPLIEAFGYKVQRAKVGNTFQFVDFFRCPPEIFFAFPVKAVLTGN